VTDYRKRPWLPLAILLAWFAWLFAMSRIGLVGLELIGQNLLPRIVWVLALGAIALGLPFFLFRRWAKHQDRAR
jgi:hypothetical protein